MPDDEKLISDFLAKHGATVLPTRKAGNPKIKYRHRPAPTDDRATMRRKYLAAENAEFRRKDFRDINRAAKFRRKHSGK